jgi:filamentous hemagglutinin family protein
MFTMLANRRFWHLGLISLVVSSIASAVNPSYAQIIPDATLGAESSVITPNVNIKGSPANQIDGGATRGANLFHSFSEFNVSNAGRVYFANPTGIENILTRVTGTNASSILGTLGVNGNASLFLINPNGIIFGENAKLDIPGSFFASTASSLNFGNGNQFSATNPEAPPLLTINVPMGVQYNHSQPAAIVNRGNLEVGQNLTLAASNLDLSGQLLAGGNLTLQATDTLRIRDTATVPFIASAGGKMEVQGNAVDIFVLNHPDSGFYSGSDMVFRSADKVGGDAHYSTGGNFRIEKLDGSLGSLYSPYDPVIKANGDVTLGGYSGSSLHILAGGSVNITGLVDISSLDPTNFIAENVPLSKTLPDGTSSINIDGSQRLTLDVRAGIDWSLAGGLPGNTVAVTPPTATPTPTFSPTVATSADITINVISNSPGLSIFLTNQYKPNTSLPGGDIKINGIINTATSSGDGGDLIIDSRRNIELSNAVVLTGANFPSTGNSGAVAFIANEEISLINTTVSSASLGANNAGDVTLMSDIISLTNSRIQSSSNGAGNQGGNINIDSRQVMLRDGGIIRSDSGSLYFQARGGNITVNATESFELSGTATNGFPSSLAAGTRKNGASGDITINTPKLTLENGAVITTLTTGVGNAGNLTVNSDVIKLTGTSPGSIIPEKPDPTLINSNSLIPSGLLVDTLGSGKAGNLTINARQFIAENGGVASASTFSTGQGGSITLNASESVKLSGTSNDGQIPSGVFAGTVKKDAIGNGGSVNISTPKIDVLDGARVTVETIGQGNAGTVNINAPQLTVSGVSSVDNKPSSISAQTSSQGSAGELNINTEKLSVSNGGQVLVNTTNQGNAGNVMVNASQSVEVTGNSSKLTAETSSTGNAGKLNINTGKLSIGNGGQVVAKTTSTGNAGALVINASSVDLDGNNTGLYLNSTGSGNAGGIKISTPGDLNIQNGAQVNVSGTGTGNPGNIDITAKDVLLTNQGSITAFTNSGEDANINLKVNDSIRLRFNSEIVTEARGTGNGGNITLNAPNFIFAVLSENSDIVANAFAGKGGRIDATATGVLGFILFNKVRTPESDFTASSASSNPLNDGIVNINAQTGVQPSILPSKLLPELVDGRCQVGYQRRSRSSFQITKTNNSPLSYNQADEINRPEVDIRIDNATGEKSDRPAENISDRSVQNSTNSNQLVEAQGFIVNRQGKIELTDVAPVTTLYSSLQSPQTCSLQQANSHH